MWRKEPCLKLSGYLEEMDDVERSKDVEIVQVEDPLGVDWDFFFHDAKHNTIAQSLEQAAKSRCTDRTRLLAFAMCRHKRLGELSPARWIPKDVLRLIYQAMKDTDYLVVFGHHASDKTPLAYKLELQKGAQFCRLPDPPFAVRNPAVVALGCEKFAVLGGTVGGRVNRKLIIFESGKWKVDNSFPSLDREMLGPASVVRYKSSLIILGGSTGEKSRSSGVPDFVFDLNTKKISYLPYRPYFEKFWRVSNTFLVSSFLIVFARGYYCTDLMEHERFSFTTPENPARCCNQFVCLDLEHEERGWMELPWLSSSHMGSIEMFFQGTKIIIEAGGERNVVRCPCCGPDPGRNPNSYFLDLRELRDFPYWRFNADEEKFDANPSNMISNAQVLECARGNVFVGGSKFVITEQGEGVQDHIQDIRLNSVVIAQFKPARKKRWGTSPKEKEEVELVDVPTACEDNGFGIVSFRQ